MFKFAHEAQMRRRFRLTLEARARDGPIATRLRRLLKCVLRRFGFTCLNVEEVKPQGRPVERQEDLWPQPKLSQLAVSSSSSRRPSSSP